MKLLLIGEDVILLRELAMDLRLRGFDVALARERDELRSSLEPSSPDIVILDHIEPMDIFVLNPRTLGYDGPLLLLVSEDVPLTISQCLQDARIVRKPLSVDVLIQEIAALEHV